MKRAVARARSRVARVNRVETGLSATKRARQFNTRPTVWGDGEFVAIDGEGFSEGREHEHIITGRRDGEVRQSRYVRRDHFYAYLSASDGSQIYSPSRLSLVQCLRFLFDIRLRNARAIIVAFGASYDICHMVCHDLCSAEIERLMGRGDRKPVLVSCEEYTYQLEYRPRKCFTVRRWALNERRWNRDDKGNLKQTKHETLHVWDVIGFFQESFANVLKKWVPGDPDFEMIKRMKGERAIFDRAELDAIIKYNEAELRLLVKVMDKLRAAINDLGLKITRWDGAGAIAAAMLAKHKVKEHKAELPDNVFHAARCAYSGGHIEACKLGFHATTTYHIDVNSAYPSEFKDLPSLRVGYWTHNEANEKFALRQIGKYSLVKVSWDFPPGLPFYPLFYRQEDGSIIYPRRGSGWYWASEYFVAARYAANTVGARVTVREWYSLVGAEKSERPFSWLEDYYQRRKDYIRADKLRGVTDGIEIVIKLGLNSLYGKTAQQVGFRFDRDGELRLPPYFQIDWAGYVTAGCRAKLMDAAIQKPHSIIMFATDGLFSTEPLEVDCPEEKELGKWEFKTHSGITVVMPGVYWLHDGEEIKHYSRGFDKAEMNSALPAIHAAWKRGDDMLPVKLRRMVGLGTITGSEEFWKMRGCFADTTRILALDGDNSKRFPINDIKRAKPHTRLVDTVPRDHELINTLDYEIPDSAPYPVAWLDGVVERDLLEGEMADELEAADAENA